MQTHVRQLSAHLAAGGHELLVLAPGRSGVDSESVSIVGRPVGIPYNGSVAPICFSRRSAARVRSELERFAPDVVHAHEPFAPSTSMLAVMQTGAPVVATFHAYADRSRLLSVAAPFLRHVWNRLDVRVAVSKAAAAFVGRQMGGPLDVVPNAIDARPFEEARAATLPPGPKILFVGRLEPRKGFPVALRAFERIVGAVPGARLIVAGDGQDRRAYDELPPTLKERITMLGRTSNAALPTYFAAADVFVASATGREAFGIVLLEAMAAGLPVVASDIPGYREVVRDGIEGLLVPAGDAAAVARAIAAVVTDRDLARRLSAAGRRRADGYSWGAQAGRVFDLYDAAIDGRGLAGRSLPNRERHVAARRAPAARRFDRQQVPAGSELAER